MAKKSTLNNPGTDGRRTRCLGIAFVVASLALAACSDSGSTAPPSSTGAVATADPTASAPTATAEPDTDADLRSIPDGTYRRVVTTADGEALGLDPEFVAEFLGPDGQMPIGLRIEGDGYEILVTNEAGIEEVGDLGTVGYGEGGRLEIVDSVDAELAIDWTQNDGALTTDLIGDGNDPDTRLVWTGEWVLEGSAADDGHAQTIPDGMYRREITMADGEALGLDPEFVAEFLGPDGQMPIGLLIEGDGYEILVTNEAGIEEVGDLGTVGYGEGGRLEIVDSADAELAIDWTQNDGALTTELIGDGNDPDTRLVWTGEWVLEGSGADGEAAGDVVSLTFANPLSDLPPQIISFATEVRNIANETIEWDVRQRAGDESEIIASVLAGDVDIAWVGARAFPEYDALLAPMLVDSYELQTAVFERGIVDRLSEALADRGLIAIAVYPGPLQRVVGVERPIMSATDFEGRTIGLFSNPPLQRATIEALGAVPAAFEEYMEVSELDGFVGQLGAVTGNSYEDEVAAVTANLNFWPRPLVVFMSVDRFEQLDDLTQRSLLSGGTAAFEAAAVATLRDDQDSLGYLCDSPVELIEATPADLAGVRTALESVYAVLGQNPTTAAVIDEITVLKNELAVAPTRATCEAP